MVLFTDSTQPPVEGHSRTTQQLFQSTVLLILLTVVEFRNFHLISYPFLKNNISYLLVDFQGFEYSRSGNPTRNCLEKAVAALDGAKYCK